MQFPMTTLLEEVVADISALPEDEQDKRGAGVAGVLDGLQDAVVV